MAEEPKTPFEIDPTVFGNNFMQWDLNIVATQPYWQKKMNTVTWKNNGTTGTSWENIENLLENFINQFLGDVLLGGGGTLVPGKDIGSGTVTVWNNGDQPAWAKFQVSAPGRAWIQDGIGGAMVPLPLTTDVSQGPILVDTDPTARTLTAASDPVDPLLYQILNNSGLLSVLFDNLGLESDEPIWKQFQYFFTTPIPANTLATLKVYHSDPNGTVTLMMPQAFNMAYG